MPTFTWSPDYQASKDMTPKVRKIQFGDGYEQRVRDGMNNLPEVWSVRFVNRPIEEIDEIDDFLRNLAGADSFDWTPPRASEARKFKCESWQRAIDHPTIDSLSATFTEVFEP